MFVIASASGSGGQDVLFVFSILIVVLCCLAITCYDKFGSSWVCTLLVVNCSKDITPIAGVDAFHSIICLLLAFIQAHFLPLENIFTDEYIYSCCYSKVLSRLRQVHNQEGILSLRGNAHGKTKSILSTVTRK